MASVEAVSVNPEHTFSKAPQGRITLIAGLGVDGDAHAGTTVKHRSRVARDPSQPNLRQVHLIAGELHDELRALGVDVDAGQMGENITTRGLDLLGLPTGTRMYLGPDAVIEVTGLRNPCGQLNQLHTGLKDLLSPVDAAGNVDRRAGVMAIVLDGGVVEPGDSIRVELPAEPHTPLEPV
ncbi:MAG TPA: MOSC domain-containing protein [Acidimicrobiia bacterium]|jgi:MOSC domain-containing protein YiiM|nr:MOSC domain-containing protein [Acidimicrobiia bacterium]